MRQQKNQDLVNEILTMYTYNINNNLFLYNGRFIQFPESSITKDNPAFSMVNDSEEDAPYGSDDESHKPLNPPNDDSD